MKKVIIIILSVIIALDAGLLVYGAISFGGAASYEGDLGELVAPVNPDAYAAAIAEWIALYAESNDHRTLSAKFNLGKNPDTFAAEVNGWFDVFGAADPATSILTRYADDPAGLVANVLVPVTYNQNRSTQFRVTSHYEINAGGKVSYSDNTRVRKQPRPAYADFYYLSLAWTGSSGFANLRARFNDQQLNSIMNSISSYDAATGAYEYQLRKPTKETKDGDLDREVPFKIYDLLNIPIYLGGGDKKGDNSDCLALVESDVIDGSTVVVTAPTEEKPYYTITFSEDLVAAQRKENVYDRLNETLGGKMSNITIKKADFVVEIWECGLFRQVTTDFEINAKISGKQGDAQVGMNFKFYYDDYNCDVIRLIANEHWEQYLSESNRAKFENMKKVY